MSKRNCSDQDGDVQLVSVNYPERADGETRRSRRGVATHPPFKQEDREAGEVNCPSCKNGICTSKRGCNVIACTNSRDHDGKGFHYFCLHCKGPSREEKADCDCKERIDTASLQFEQKRRNKRAKMNPIVIANEPAESAVATTPSCATSNDNLNPMNVGKAETSKEIKQRRIGANLQVNRACDNDRAGENLPEVFGDNAVNNLYSKLDFASETVSKRENASTTVRQDYDRPLEKSINVAAAKVLPAVHAKNTLLESGCTAAVTTTAPCPFPAPGVAVTPRLPSCPPAEPGFAEGVVPAISTTTTGSVAPSVACPRALACLQTPSAALSRTELPGEGDNFVGDFSGIQSVATRLVEAPTLGDPDPITALKAAQRDALAHQLEPWQRALQLAQTKNARSSAIEQPQPQPQPQPQQQYGFSQEKEANQQDVATGGGGSQCGAVATSQTQTCAVMALKKENCSLQARIDYLKREKACAMERIKELESYSDEKAKALLQKDEENQQLQNEIKALRDINTKTAAEKERNCDEYKEKNRDMQSELEGSNKKAPEQGEALVTARQELDNARKDSSCLESDIDNFAIENESLQAQPRGMDSRRSISTELSPELEAEEAELEQPNEDQASNASVDRSFSKGDDNYDQNKVGERVNEGEEIGLFTDDYSYENRESFVDTDDDSYIPESSSSDDDNEEEEGCEEIGSSSDSEDNSGTRKRKAIDDSGDLEAAAGHQQCMEEKDSVNDSKWTERYNELVQYKDWHGDCNVPQRFKDNPKLGSWVFRQRQQYKNLKSGKKSHMTAQRIDMLKSIGFTWPTHK